MRSLFSLLLGWGRSLPCAVATMLLAAQIRAGTAPVITLQPQSTNLTVGQNAVLSVTASGTSPFSYLWMHEGTNLFWGTTASITLTNAGYYTTGHYSVGVSNAFGGTISATALVGLSAVPISTNGPISTEVYQGNDVVFSVGVYSLTPVGYQWYYGNSLLTAQTNASLRLHQVGSTNVGTYFVVMTNAVGKSSSLTALLLVDAPPAPGIRLGDPDVTATHLSFPIVYLANSGETNISFSVSYDPSVLADVEFLLDPVVVGTNVTFSSRSNAFGVSIQFPSGHALEAGETNIGTAEFELASLATNLFAGRIGFANSPIPLEVQPILTNYLTIITNETVVWSTHTNGSVVVTNKSTVVTLTTNTVILPQVVQPALTGSRRVTGLNPVNGLMEESIEIANPSDRLIDNLFLTVAYEDTLGTVAQTNLITLHNATGTLIPSGWFINEGAIAAGEHRWLLLQYYASDRATMPHPDFTISGTQAILTNGPKGSLTLLGRTHIETNGVTLKFLTQTNFHYYVQFAPGASELNDPAVVETVTPSFVGTGRPILWVDSAFPNRTNGVIAPTRIYRVIETP